MTLADDLRATLRHEADQRPTSQLDLERLIGGGRRRRRRRTALRTCVASAAVVALAAVYGVSTHDPTQSKSEHVASRPSAPPLMNGDRPAIAGGPYRVLVGVGATGERISADFTVRGSRWLGGDYARVTDGNGANAGFGVYQPTALAAGSGCSQGRPASDVATTPEGLATQLAALPRSTVLREPSSTSAFGQTAVHLRLRIDVECRTGYYRVAEAPGGSRGISYSPSGMPSADVVIDFWVLDLGVPRPVVVDLWHDVGASPALVRQAADARNSISFVGVG